MAIVHNHDKLAVAVTVTCNGHILESERRTTTAHHLYQSMLDFFLFVKMLI